MHEAAHAAVAFELKIKFDYVTIIWDEDTTGHLQHDKSLGDKIWWLTKINHTAPYAIDLAERRIVIAFAGMVAQRKFMPRSNWYDSAAGDFENINKWLYQLKAGPLEHHVDFYDAETNDFYGDTNV